MCFYVDMLASEALGILLIIIIFFTFWLTKTFAHAVLSVMITTILLSLLPFQVISSLSLMTAILTITVLSIITQFVVSHDQAAQQRELDHEESSK